MILRKLQDFAEQPYIITSKNIKQLDYRLLDLQIYNLKFEMSNEKNKKNKTTEQVAFIPSAKDRWVLRSEI